MLLVLSGVDLVPSYYPGGWRLDEAEARLGNVECDLIITINVLHYTDHSDYINLHYIECKVQCSNIRNTSYSFIRSKLL